MQDNINSSKKLNGKDLINTGIFTAIYLTLTMAVACTIGMLPLGYVLLSFIVPFISEFVAAMDKMHITKKFAVPISVMFRFFPTIAEEYKNVLCWNPRY